MDEAAPDSEETRALLEQIRGGNALAFEALLGRHRAALRRFVDLRLDTRLRGRVDASDVVQETQLEAFHRLPDFLERRPMPFHLWLRKTAYERLLKIHRHHLETARRAVSREERLPDKSSLLLAERLLGANPSPSQEVAREEAIACVRQALATLSATDREILLMRNFEELSYQEIGILLDLDPPTARKRYGRALLRLRKLLFDTGLAEGASDD
jgi:RNA polymerase sigma-70 factor (ECF subfamily)